MIKHGIVIPKPKYELGQELRLDGEKVFVLEIGGLCVDKDDRRLYYMYRILFYDEWIDSWVSEQSLIEHVG